LNPGLDRDLDLGGEASSNFDVTPRRPSSMDRNAFGVKRKVGKQHQHAQAVADLFSHSHNAAAGARRFVGADHDVIGAS
jgi:hypothetical protein